MSKRIIAVNLLATIILVLSCQKDKLPESITPGNADGNHFPLTKDSWWRYDDLLESPDSLTRENIGTITFGSQTYNELAETDQDDDYITSYYVRKNEKDYFEYVTVDWYTTFYFDTQVYDDILFLKEGLNNGNTWYSKEWSGSVQGVPTRLRYFFTCTDNNGSVTIGGKMIPKVYKIDFKPQRISGTGNTWVDDTVRWTMYFAEGIGLVYTKAVYTNGGVFESKLGSWKVF